MFCYIIILKGLNCNFNIFNIKSKKLITEKMGVTQTILERMENNMLKWYGHVLHMEDNTWPKRTITWSPEGRRRRGRLKM
jgi:hypothetical protein